MRYFIITQLKPDLIFAKWYFTPVNNTEVVQKYFARLRHLLQIATTPIYAVADLRDGQITEARWLYELSKVLDHPHWGGGVAFSEVLSGTVYADMFAQFSEKEQPATHSLDAALATLETLKPGITQGVDWMAVLAAHERYRHDDE